jgi:hypothetical protein
MTIMGSYQRGKHTCENVDIMITHPDYDTTRRCVRKHWVSRGKMRRSVAAMMPSTERETGKVLCSYGSSVGLLFEIMKTSSMWSTNPFSQKLLSIINNKQISSV